MKEFKFLVIAPIVMLYNLTAFAQESQHWVCKTEPLYRELLSARLYGVGTDPAEGCVKLPTGVAIEQLECVETDFALCQYRWEGLAQDETFWGSPIIKPLPAAAQ